MASGSEGEASSSRESALPLSHPRLAALDGLRGIAVLGVLLFHADVPWVSGGLLGVDVFFVLSGFLITGILVNEFARSGQIDLLEFYRRRAKRLFPALWLLLAVVAIGARWIYADAALRLRTDIPAAILYVSNWWYTWKHQSYFEATGRPALLQHLWSLAIEEQFYLVWPVAVWMALRRWRPEILGGISALLAIGAAVAMAFLAQANDMPASVDPTPLYFGTHTHTMGLLLGAALAIFWRRVQHGKAISPRANLSLTLVGIGALAGVVYSFASTGEQAPFLYRGGFLAISGLVCLVLMAATAPGCSFARSLSVQPLQIIGRLSYGLYLWHFPIFMVTRPSLDIALDGWSLVALRLALTSAAASLSYWLVERPIHQGHALERTWQQLRDISQPWPGRLRPSQALSVLSAAACAGAAAYALITISPANLAVPTDVHEALGLTNGGPTSVIIARSGPPKAPQPSSIFDGDSAHTPDLLETARKGPLTAVGDSVLLGSRFLLEQSVTDVQVDAEIGRQAAQVVTRLQALKAENGLSQNVLLHFGTNGLVTERQLRTMLDLLKDHHVVVANTRVPRKWMQPNNELIARVLPEYPNVALADWAAISGNHPEYFVSDGTHLTIRGQQAFVGEIVRAGAFEPIPQPAPLEAANPPQVSGKAEFLVAEPVATTASGGMSSIGAAPPEEPSRFRNPIALDSYWQTVAKCETSANWNSRRPESSGGLSITHANWETWGGEEFAPTAADATPEQQITVANRISTQGWRQQTKGTLIAPAGFGAWACAQALPPARLVTRDPGAILRQIFSRKSPKDSIRDLQAIVGIQQDGKYGPATAKAHAKALVALNLPRIAAPDPSPHQ